MIMNEKDLVLLIGIASLIGSAFVMHQLKVYKESSNMDYIDASSIENPETPQKDK